MTIELNVFGTYKPGPWQTAGALQQAIAKREWSPSTADFKIFAETSKSGKVEGAFNSFNLLCAIIRQRPDRLNIFTHANAQYIYLSGWVVPGDVIFNTHRPENALDVEFLDDQEANDVHFRDSITTDASYPQLRESLSKNFTIHLYACHVALGRELCQGIANYFQRPLRAFSDEIRYYPPDKSKRTGWGWAVGTNPTVSNFHDLDKYISAPFKPSAKRK